MIRKLTAQLFGFNFKWFGFILFTVLKYEVSLREEKKKQNHYNDFFKILTVSCGIVLQLLNGSLYFNGPSWCLQNKQQSMWVIFIVRLICDHDEDDDDDVCTVYVYFYVKNVVEFNVQLWSRSWTLPVFRQARWILWQAFWINHATK